MYRHTVTTVLIRTTEGEGGGVKSRSCDEHYNRQNRLALLARTTILKKSAPRRRPLHSLYHDCTLDSQLRKTMKMKIVCYYRVSTHKQFTSFDVQRETIAQFAGAHSGTIIAEYREVESGRKRNRPELLKALEHAKYSGATLVVAKLDRLARDVSFMSGLMEAGVDFVICDFPEATPLLIHLLAAIAEYEAKLIRDRTREALRQKKRDGVLLGSHRPEHWKRNEDRRLVGATKGNLRSALVRTAKASERLHFFRGKIVELRRAGKTYEQIAAELNSQSFTTPRGKPFTKSTICKILR